MSLQKGLLLHYTMDDKDTEGTTIRDSSAYDRDGTISGGVTTSVSGQVNEAYSFDGVNGLIETGYGQNDDWSVADRTISLWVNQNSANTGRALTKHPGNTPVEMSIQGTEGAIDVTVRDTSTFVESSISVSDNTWAHIVVVLERESAETLSTYKNGSLVKSISTSGLADESSNAEVLIGDLNDAGADPWDGEIDDVRIYNRALSESEINQLYQMRSPRTQSNDLAKGLVMRHDYSPENINNGDLSDSTPYNGGATGLPGSQSGEGRFFALTEGGANVDTVPQEYKDALLSYDYTITVDLEIGQIDDTGADWPDYYGLGGGVNYGGWRFESEQNSIQSVRMYHPEFQESGAQQLMAGEAGDNSLQQGDRIVISWVYDYTASSETRTYTDGVLDDTVPASGNDLETGYGGNITINPNTNLEFTIYDFMVHNRPLSESEVNRLHQRLGK